MKKVITLVLSMACLVQVVHTNGRRPSKQAKQQDFWKAVLARQAEHEVRMRRKKRKKEYEEKTKSKEDREFEDQGMILRPVLERIKEQQKDIDFRKKLES